LSLYLLPSANENTEIFSALRDCNETEGTLYRVYRVKTYF